MINLIKAELYQLKVRRSPKIWLLMSIIMSAAVVMLPYFLGSDIQSILLLLALMLTLRLRWHLTYCWV